METGVKKLIFRLNLSSFLNQLNNFFAPRQTEEEKRRRELIFNTLLIFSWLGFFIINIVQIIDPVLPRKNPELLSTITLPVFIFFIFLFWLSRRGWLKTASILLIATFSGLMFYSFVVWGVDLPAALLLAVLVIGLSGILLNGRLVLVSTLTISLFLIILSSQPARELIRAESYWRHEPTYMYDTIINSVLISIIAAIAWLFCREIKRSLNRALNSEKLLSEERDSLEIKVETRTKELHELESEKINQLYRLAEFGRLSSGIFHDLINPLTAISLNLAQIKNDTNVKISDTKSYLGQALLATSKMKLLIASIKKQLSGENTPVLFSLNQEIEQIIQIMSYQARRAKVSLRFCASHEIKLEGDVIKFGQIVSNLLANAIEACEEAENAKNKEVIIKLIEGITEIELIVTDSGNGISPENLTKIFIPFFSTKKTSGRGLGLGLPSTKNIIEKSFSGRINVMSPLNQGATFTVDIPKGAKEIS